MRYSCLKEPMSFLDFKRGTIMSSLETHRNELKLLSRHKLAFLKLVIALSMMSALLIAMVMHPNPTHAHNNDAEPTWALPYSTGTQVSLGESGLHAGNFYSIPGYTFQNVGQPDASLDLGFLGATGTSSIPATSLASGKVLATWPACNLVLIDHGNGWWAIYIHLTNILVSPGEYVSTNTPIGYPTTKNLGCGQWSTFTHVHFALLRGSGNTGIYVSMTGTVLCGHTVLSNSAAPHDSSGPLNLEGLGRNFAVPSCSNPPNGGGQPTFTGAHTPVAAKDTDGRLEVFEVAQDGQLWHNYQMSGNKQWSGWEPMGGNWPGDPAVALNSNGTLEVFVIGDQGPNRSGGGLFHAWQTSPGAASWTGWQMMAGAWPSGTPAVAHNNTGGLEVFLRGLDTQLYHLWQCGNCSAGWSPPQSLGGTWSHDPTVIQKPNGYLEVFITGQNTQLYHAWQNYDGSWSGWQSLHGTWPGDPVVTVNPNGYLEVFMRGQNTQLYHDWQCGSCGSGWSGWFSLGGTWPRDPVVANNVDGRMEIFMVGQNTVLYDNWEDSSGNWYGWHQIGGTWSGQPAVALNLINGLEIFMVGNDHQMYHQWQVSSGSSGSYTGWIKLM